MSIRDEINHRIREGRLFHLPHAIPSAPTGRTMFVSQEIVPLAFGPWVGRTAHRFAQLRAHLDAFTENRLISVAVDPYDKANSAYLAPIDPISDGVWDIRSIDPSPAIRVLGCFAEIDVFVSLIWSYRKDLGGPGSKEWRDFRERAKASWRNLFPTYRPLIAGTPNEYISQNIHLV